MILRLRLALVATLVGALALAACGGQTTPAAVSPSPSGDAAAGQTKFAGSCAACHGADALGVAGLGKNLTTSDFTRGLSDEELVAFIKVGRPTSDPANTTGVDMPPKGGNPALSDSDLADIVAYLRSIQK